ncbi:hypothetical protein AURDEDRAFT_116993, partial [Auricularia subglabra TFB-10046 SS5]
MAVNETGQFTPTNPLGHPSSTSRALLFYGVGAGALGLLALALVFFCWRRDRWKRSREMRVSFGSDHDHDGDDSDKFDALALPSELGGSAAVSVPLMSLSSSHGERSRSRDSTIGTSAPYSDSAAPDDRGAAALALHRRAPRRDIPKRPAAAAALAERRAARSALVPALPPAARRVAHAIIVRLTHAALDASSRLASPVTRRVVTASLPPLLSLLLAM